jgi:HIV Tat-specific factor 1
VDGADAKTPAAPVLAREERRKRKADGDDTKAPKAKRERASGTSAPKKTAVFVSNLPPTATREQLASVFSKAGVLLPDDEGNPRIKMYTDEKGQFKGEALVMYFKEGSVDLAITLLDDTQLELGSTHGNMRVVVADYDKSKTKSTATAAGATHGDGSAATAAVGEKADDGADKEKEEKEKEKEKKKQFSAEDKRRLTKRMRNLER